MLYISLFVLIDDKSVFCFRQIFVFKTLFLIFNIWQVRYFIILWPALPNKMPALIYFSVMLHLMVVRLLVAAVSANWQAGLCNAIFFKKRMYVAIPNGKPADRLKK